jgi:hypothetical protein
MPSLSSRSIRGRVFGIDITRPIARNKRRRSKPAWTGTLCWFRDQRLSDETQLAFTLNDLSIRAATP